MQAIDGEVTIRSHISSNLRSTLKSPIDNEWFSPYSGRFGTKVIRRFHRKNGTSSQ
jgi:hypothetical protein